MKNNLVITIARQYGSLGLDIGQRAAKRLDINLYDKELITMSAKESSISADLLRDVDEKAANSLLYTLALGSSIYNIPSTLGYNLPMNDKLFLLQSDIIKKLAEKSPCIIVGRCSDYVLRNYIGRVAVFIYADAEFRKKQIAERLNVTESEALDLMHKTDRRRMNYYNFYTGRKWGRTENYNLMIDSSKLEVDDIAELVCNYAAAHAKKNDCTIK